MKKILITLFLLLGGMTAAWAGTGNGTKEHPFTGEWTASEIGPRLEAGNYLAFDCVIKDVNITVFDSNLWQTVAQQWTAWSPGNLIENATDGPYKQYCEDNSPEDRRRQSFILTEVSPSAKTSTQFTITGYFSGFYRDITEAVGFYNVYTPKQMKIVLQANANAKIRLTDDIYLSDKADDDTFCSTFTGILDGDGYTIYGSKDGTRQNRNYLFTYSDGATFKNLTFKHIRKNSEDHDNQAIITSQATNNCVFENITFENCGTWTNKDNAGSAAGWAENCTFTNITVKNSDFTVDVNQAGCVVGYALGCTFTNIKVENCESTSAADYFGSGSKSGGVAGRTDNCTISNVEILGCFIKTYCKDVGGVVGYAVGTQITNCVVDDQSCICSGVTSKGGAYAGGIAGEAFKCNIDNCINSSLVSSQGFNAGGIVGWAGSSGSIDGCLNTGMVINIKMKDVQNGFYNKYKTKSGMTCVTKTYQGKVYVIRKYDGDDEGSQRFGGISGELRICKVSRCANFGSVSADDVCGGITGYLAGGTISDCLIDFTGRDAVNGICGRTTGNSRIDNCLNMTTYRDIEALDDDWTDFKSNDNNYSLTTASDAKYTTKTTVDELASGKICHLLGENWQQLIGTDSHPEPGSEGLRFARAFNKEQEYGTVCVPYALKSDDNISYYTFAEASEGSDIQLKFEYADDVDAGTPVLFRVAKGTKEVCFNNAGTEFLDNPITTSYPVWNMLGTFEQKVFDGDEAKSIYYLSGGVIKNAQKTTIAPYKAYIQGPSIETLTSNGASQAKAIRFVIEDEDGETATLELVGDDLVPVQPGGKAYSLMGTEVGDGYRGLVIRNGKKVMQNR